MFKNSFLRLHDYSDISLIRSTFNCLSNVNKEFSDIQQFKNSKFFMMRSSTQDDIHKAMKYGVWTSTLNHNEILNNAFIEA